MSTIRVDNFGPSSGGTTYSARGIAKAWVNFNGTGTVAIRDSENISSITDYGVAKFASNFTNAMNAADYSVSGTANQDGSGWGQISIESYASGYGLLTGQIATRILGYAGGFDPTIGLVNVHGDLA